MPVNAVSIAQALATINPMMAGVVGLLNIIKTVTDAARAANPDAPAGTFPTDAERIEKVLTEAGLLKAEAGELRAWLATQQ